MSIDWEIAGGSVPGRSHVRAGKPNQDAYAFRAEGRRLVAVVCDGCGSGARSEVGAALGVRLVIESAMRRMREGAPASAPELWEGVRGDVLGALGAMAGALGGSLAEVVSEFFLFTVLGLAIDGERAVVFGVGDGVYAIDGELRTIGPFPRNEPPYLGYGLLDRGPRFSIHCEVAAGALGSALLGTDGAADLEAIAARPMPGAEEGERVGPIDRFWKDDRYLRNPDAIRRRLSLLNRESVRPRWDERVLAREAGLLEDDTTIVVVRRRA